MEATRPPTEPLIPLALLERVEALASVQDRPAGEIVREAISDYLKHHASAIDLTRQACDAQRQAALGAGVRIRDRRKYRPMPDGMTIRAMIDAGRK